MLLCLALRWSFSDLLPLVDPWFGLPDRACLVSLRLGLPNLYPELSYHGSGSLVSAPFSWFVSSHADGLVHYQGDWSALKTGGSSGLIGGCQVLFFDSDMRSVFAFGHHPDL
ncbi:hypothetical protein U1Q18_031445 [Sarracenia purpurea var. burkii]